MIESRNAKGKPGFNPGLPLQYSSSPVLNQLVRRPASFGEVGESYPQAAFFSFSKRNRANASGVGTCSMRR